MVTYHRGFVDYEDGVGKTVVLKHCETAGKIAGWTAVNLAVDCVGWMGGMRTEDLGRTPGRSEKHDRSAHLFERLDKRAGKRCLAGSGIAVDDEHRVGRSGRGTETRKRVNKQTLLLIGGIGQLRPDQI